MNAPLPVQRLTDEVCVAPQLTPDAMAAVAAAGFRSVVNNRPDFEGGPDQPTSAAIEAAALAAGLPLELDAIHRPVSHFSTMVHQGCTRNEYHEYNIEDSTPGGKACMFFNLGCQGPLTRAVCNTDLWNGVSSKTRAGVPCFGCTSPNFPHDGDLFSTEKIGDVPIRLPLGVERPRYMAYKNLARSAAPPRVRNKKMEP